MNQKSTLLATMIASACGIASAQSSVTVYGTLDAFAGRMQGPATGVNASDKAIWKVEGGGMSTSHLGFRGSEDLGGGLRAVFDISAFMRNDTGAAGRSEAVGPPVNVAADTFWSRYSWVGVASNDLGRIRLGNITTLLFVNSVTSNAFGDSTTFAPLNLATHIGTPQAGGTSWTNSVVYDSPTLAGFTLNLARSMSEGQNGGNKSARLSYAQGPFMASAVWQSVKKDPVTFSDGTTKNNVRTWMVGGSYDFQFAKVFAHYGSMLNKGVETAPQNIDYKISEISLQVPIKLNYLLVGYAVRKTSDMPSPVPATVAGGNIKREALTASYDYYFSKRTDLYAIIMNDKTRTLTVPAPFSVASASGTSYGIGVRHRF